eukprot:g11466.t1
MSSVPEEEELPNSSPDFSSSDEQSEKRRTKNDISPHDHGILLGGVGGGGSELGGEFGAEDERVPHQLPRGGAGAGGLARGQDEVEIDRDEVPRTRDDHEVLHFEASAGGGHTINMNGLQPTTAYAGEMILVPADSVPHLHNGHIHQSAFGRATATEPNLNPHYSAAQHVNNTPGGHQQGVPGLPSGRRSKSSPRTADNILSARKSIDQLLMLGTAMVRVSA